MRTIRVLKMATLMFMLTACSPKPERQAIVSVIDSSAIVPETTSKSTSATPVREKKTPLFSFQLSQVGDTAALRHVFLEKYDSLNDYDTIGWNKLQMNSVLAFDEENPGEFKCVSGYIMSIDHQPPFDSDEVPAPFGWDHYFFHDSAGVYNVYNNNISESNYDNYDLNSTRLVLDYDSQRGCPLLGIETDVSASDGFGGYKHISFYIWSESDLEFRKVTDELITESNDRGGTAKGEIVFHDTDGLPEIGYTLSGDDANQHMNHTSEQKKIYHWSGAEYLEADEM